MRLDPPAPASAALHQVRIPTVVLWGLYSMGGAVFGELCGVTVWGSWEELCVEDSGGGAVCGELCRGSCTGSCVG